MFPRSTEFIFCILIVTFRLWWGKQFNVCCQTGEEVLQEEQRILYKKKWRKWDGSLTFKVCSQLQFGLLGSFGPDPPKWLSPGPLGVQFGILPPNLRAPKILNLNLKLVSCFFSPWMRSWSLWMHRLRWVRASSRPFVSLCRGPHCSRTTVHWKWGAWRWCSGQDLEWVRSILTRFLFRWLSWQMLWLQCCAFLQFCVLYNSVIYKIFTL